MESHRPFTVADCRRMILPKRVWQSSQAIDDEGLLYQKKDRYFDNDQLFRLRDDPSETISVVAPAGG